MFFLTLLLFLIYSLYTVDAASTQGLSTATGIKIDVKGKVALVTGASSGIGRAVAKQFAISGLRVIVTARRERQIQDLVKEISALGGEAIAVRQDVAIEEDHVRVMSMADSSFGGVDFVLANAGLEGPIGNWDLGPFKQVYEVNVVGVWLSLKHAMPHFRKRGGGALIAVSSFSCSLPATFLVGLPIPYIMSKHALDGFVRLSAATYAPENIRVYNIKPAVYSSEIIDRVSKHLAVTPKQIAQLNPYFKEGASDPSLLAHVALAMFNNSTRWRPGQTVVCDGDATLSDKIFQTNLEDPSAFPSAEELKPLLCDASGGPYLFPHLSNTAEL